MGQTYRGEKQTKEQSQRQLGKAMTNELNNRVSNRRSLSNEQLDKTIVRLQKEKQLRELGESELTPAKSMVTSVLKRVGKETLTGLGYAASSAALKSIAKKYGSKAAEIESIISSLDLSTKKGAAQAAQLAPQVERLRLISELFGTGSSYVKSKTKKK